MRLTLNHRIDVHEGGRIVVHLSVPDAKAHGIELSFDPLVLTVEQSAELFEMLSKARAKVTQKPAAVSLGDVWRCVGIEDELVARERVEFGDGSADVGLAPDEGPYVTTVRAREVDMLGLKEWTFVRAGAR